MDERESQAQQPNAQEQLIEKANRQGGALGLPGQLTVRRSNGELDSGWLVLSPTTGEDGQEEVVVVKDLNGQASHKIISLEEARQLNPAPPEQSLITGVPPELGGEQVRAESEADSAKRAAERSDVIGLHTNIHSAYSPQIDQVGDTDRPQQALQ